MFADGSPVASRQYESVIRSEDLTRNLNGQIAELEVRVAFPKHWSDGEHQMNLMKLRKLNKERSQLNKIDT